MYVNQQTNKLCEGQGISATLQDSYNSVIQYIYMDTFSLYQKSAPPAIWI